MNCGPKQNFILPFFSLVINNENYSFVLTSSRINDAGSG